MDTKPVDYESQETVINTLAADTQHAWVYTCEKNMLTKMAKLAEAHPEAVKVLWSDGYAIKYEVPKKWVKITPPRNVNLTDEQKEVMRERAKRMNLARNNNEKSLSE